jgi:hypothetical protein
LLNPSKLPPVQLLRSQPDQTETTAGHTNEESVAVSANAGFFGMTPQVGVSVSYTASMSTSYSVPSVQLEDHGYDYVDKIIHLNTDDQRNGSLQLTFWEVFSVDDPGQGERKGDLSDPASIRVFELQFWLGVILGDQLLWHSYKPVGFSVHCSASAISPLLRHRWC